MKLVDVINLKPAITSVYAYQLRLHESQTLSACVCACVCLAVIIINRKHFKQIYTNKAPLTEINLIQDRGATGLMLCQIFFNKILPKNFFGF